MKLIKPGEFPVEWYFKVENICHRCGCVYGLEPGDRLEAGDDQRDGEWVASICPTCKAIVTTSRGR